MPAVASHAAVGGCAGKVDCTDPADQVSVAWCAFKASRIVILDDAFSPLEVDMLRAALQAWTQATEGRVSYAVDRTEAHEVALSYAPATGDLVLLKLDSQRDAAAVQNIDKAVNPAGNGSSYVVGFTTPGRVAILADRIGSRSAFLTVALHELGHDLGLPHSETTASVMYPRVSQLTQCLRDYPHPTHSDRLAVASLYCPEDAGTDSPSVLVPVHEVDFYP